MIVTAPWRSAMKSVTRWRWLSWGGVLASLLWIGGSLLFSWYVANFGSYNKMYGSLGAVIGFMTWIWLSATIILLGAELNSELEPQIEPEIRTDPR
jgi:membrane protein